MYRRMITALAAGIAMAPAATPPIAAIAKVRDSQ